MDSASRQSERPTPSPRSLAARLRRWYAGGERGLLQLCETEDAPEAVKAAARRWFERGYARFDVICNLLESYDEDR